MKKTLIITFAVLMAASFLGLVYLSAIVWANNTGNDTASLVLALVSVLPLTAASMAIDTLR